VEPQDANDDLSECTAKVDSWIDEEQHKNSGFWCGLMSFDVDALGNASNLVGGYSDERRARIVFARVTAETWPCFAGQSPAFFIDSCGIE
jgi:hypothetical protein